MMAYQIPVSVFLSYAHEDEFWLNELLKHLSLLKRQGLMSTWYDRQIVPGTNWAKELDQRLEQASIILLLVSADFLASDYCYQIEMERALERHKAGEAKVIPIAVRPTNAKGAPFADLETLPTNGEAISVWVDRDKAFVNVVEAIHRAIEGKPLHPESISQVTPLIKPITTTNLNNDRGQILLRLQSIYREELDSSFAGIDQTELKLAALPTTFWSNTTITPHYDFPVEYAFHIIPIIEAYETLGRELLIVGEAGAGKSTLLLMLGQDLVKRAMQDITHPIPFIISLSTWAIKRLTLQDWISEQVVQDYHVSQKLSMEWFQQKQILLLLDGLDEVVTEARSACIAAINAYALQYTRPLVVCCRTAAFAAMHQRLYLHTVMVQSLTLEQVNKGLDRAGKPFIPLKKMFNEQTVLQEVIKIPLMLRFLLSIDPKPIVQEISQSATQNPSHQATRLKSQIVERYIQKQLSQSGELHMPSPYTTQQLQLGLTYLAKKMRDHKQTTFYLEHLQSDWLPTEQLSRFYSQLATKGIGFLLGFLIGLSVNAVIFGGNFLSFDILYGLLGGLLGGLISGENTPGFQFSAIINTLKHQWPSLTLYGLRNGLLVGMLNYLVFLIQPTGGSHEALIYGCGMCICSFLLTTVILAGKTTEVQDISPGTLVQHLWKRIVPQGLKTDHCKIGILVGPIIGLSIGISVGLTGGLSNGYGTSVGLSSGFSNGLSTGLTIGLSYMGIGILLCLPLLGEKSTIRVTDMIEWSLKNFGHQLINKGHLSITFRLFLFILCLFGFGVGTGIGLSTGWSAGISNGLKLGLSAGLSVSSAYWILFALWTGVSSKTLDDDIRIMPNEGIRRSLQNALKICFYGGLLCIFIGVSNEILYYGFGNGFSRGIYEGLKAILRDGLFIECFGALIPALLMGGITVIRHYLLRILLRIAGVLPLHTIRFLDDATSRDLLYKEGKGGGYRFAHNYVFTHFVDQDLL